MRMALAGNALLLGLLLAPTAVADSLTPATVPFERTVLIGANHYEAFSFDLSKGVTAGFEVIAGGRVDIIFTDLSGYNMYADPNSTSFTYFETFTTLSVSSYNRTVSGQQGTYAFVVDNTNWNEDGANPTGPVTLHVWIGAPSGLPVALCGAVALVAIVGVALAFYLLRRRKAAQPLPPPPPYQEPPAPAQNPTWDAVIEPVPGEAPAEPPAGTPEPLPPTPPPEGGEKGG
ncbi:MAG TPA: hypothetical protein VJ397_09475 [Thermoplasmata archaeon]|nr:hypothetical protein [Thermoplasmata archaeon]